MKRTKDYRRHQNDRVVCKRMKMRQRWLGEWDFIIGEDEFAPGKFKKWNGSCSCWMCSGPRHEKGTPQDIKNRNSIEEYNII